MNNKQFQIRRAASLAPMAGATDSAFRLLCHEHGASFTVSEMVSAKALVMGDKKTPLLMAHKAEERPFGVQLFGYEPQTMAEAAIIVERDFTPDFIDINMGCPTPKIISNGSGSALMNTPLVAAAIVRAVNDAVGIPVTAKIRAGFAEITAPSLAPLLEQAGAAAITVHGRTRSRMYKPPVDLDVIRSVKQSVSIPVIGNGDIFTPQDAVRMLERTGCDAVAVGRQALGNPFFFEQVNAMISGESLPEAPSVRTRMETLRRQIVMMCEYKGEFVALREARKHAGWYTRGLRGAAKIRYRAMELCTMNDLDSFIRLVLDINRD
ncbi:MAG: tRNA dihydrouridine synthase DusB [Oscillospiraceae bacterium]